MRKRLGQRERRAAVNAYFDGAEPPTISGLAQVLGTSRKALAGYDGRDLVVIEGLARIERYLEARIGGPGASGAMFSLRTNFDWGERKAEPVVDKASTVVSPVRRIRDLSNAELMAIRDGKW